ncbi:DNA-binding protein [Pseudomonas denitrificans (nom. rej.)]|uniref:DNA-binding protein n=1 Tax=Pseudomonas sp. NPDC086581 TaxID=3364432 RepID=UPI0037F5A47B|nr:DNA-binding protein [Pseudomonas denitrificans (nom. rej.)]
MNEESEFSPDLLAGGYYVTAQRFAQLVGLNDRPAIVQGWIDQGAIPTCRQGGQVMVDLGALLLMTQPDQA